MPRKFVTLLVGDSGVGKTSIMFKATEDRFEEGEYPSSFSKGKTVSVEGKNIDFIFYDVQYDRKTILDKIPLKYNAVAFLFDVSKRESFDNLFLWLREARNKLDKSVICGLYGNKSDSSSQKVKETEANELAESLQMKYYQISAANDNVMESFINLYKEKKQIDEKKSLMASGAKKNATIDIQNIARLRLSSRGKIERKDNIMRSSFELENYPNVGDIAVNDTPPALQPTNSIKNFLRGGNSKYQMVYPSIKNLKKMAVSSPVKQESKENINLKRRGNTVNSDMDLSVPVFQIQKDLINLMMLNEIPDFEQLSGRITKGLKYAKFENIICSKSGDNMLHIAVRKNYKEINELIKLLISIEISKKFLELKNNSGNSPLHIAVARNNIEAVKSLVQSNTTTLLTRNNILQTPFHIAAIYGRVEAMKIMCTEAKNANIKIPAHGQDSSGSTAAHLAVLHNHEEILKLLPKSIMNTKNKFGSSSTELLNYRDFESSTKADLTKLIHSSDGSKVLNLLSKKPSLLQETFEQYRNGGILHAIIRTPGLGESKTKVLSEILKKGVSCSVTDKDGNIPLHLAVIQPRVELVKQILDKTDDLEKTNDDGNTVFHMAMYAGYKDVISILFEYIRDPSILKTLNKNQLSCFHIASNGQEDAVSLLLNEDSSLAEQLTEHNETPLHIAARNNHLNIAKILVEANSSMLHQIDNYNRTPLLTASNFLSIETALYFMEYNRNSKEKIDTSIIDDLGFNAFQTLISCDLSSLSEKRLKIYFKLLKEFLKQGEDIECKVKQIDTPPLMIAAANNEYEVAKFLLDNNASVSTTNYFQDTALHLAAENFNLELVKLLLEHKAELNAVNAQQSTPLFLCCLKASYPNALPVAQLLLDRGSVLSQPSDSEKKNALHYAIERGATVEFVKLLIKYCPDKHLKELLNAQTLLGDTPLSYAISMDRLDIAVILTTIPSVVVQSRLQSTKAPYEIIPHEFLTPTDVATTDIFVPTIMERRASSTPRGLLGSEKIKISNYPRFPENQLIRQEARIYTLLGTHPGILPFSGLARPNSLVFESDINIKCSIDGYIHSQPSDRINLHHAFHLAENLASTLKFIHQILPSKPPVIHNWINRFSVLIAEDNSVKLSEFKYSVLQVDALLQSLYPSLPFSPYSAPEVIERNICSEKSDVFSFAILLWEIFTCTVAFEDIPVTKIEQAILSGKRPPLDSIKKIPEVGPYLSVVFELCWHELPEKRMTFQDLAVIFANYLRNLPKEGKPIGDIENPNIIRCYPNCFKPTVTNFRKATFTGGSGACFFFADVDGIPAVLKEFTIPEQFPLIIQQSLREIYFLKLFRGVNQINQYYYHTFADGKITLYMQFADTSLKNEIAKRKLDSPQKYFTPEECYRISLQIAIGLKEIHNYNPEDPIVHRDVKIDNIFIDNSLRSVCLGDFGIASYVSDIDPNTLIGTVGRIAPEVSQRITYGTPADVFSFGILLFELLTFQPPSEYEKSIQIRLQNDKWIPFVQLFRTCVNKVPSERPTFDEIVEQIALIGRKFDKPIKHTN